MFLLDKNGRIEIRKNFLLALVVLHDQVNIEPPVGIASKEQVTTRSLNNCSFLWATAAPLSELNIAHTALLLVSYTTQNV